MTVGRFSLSAYHDLRDAGELSRQERIVFDTVAIHGPMTRKEIAAKSGLELGSVTGRVADLIKKKGVLCEIGAKENSETHKDNGLVELSLAEKPDGKFPIVLDSAAMAQGQFVIGQEVAA